MARYLCGNEERRAVLLKSETNQVGLGGIDFVEVSADQRTLSVHFLAVPAPVGSTGWVPLPQGMTASWVRIEGGVRVTGVAVETVTVAGTVLAVTVDRSGDFSPYTLQLSEPPPTTGKPLRLDPRLSAVDFSFKVDCPSAFDCKPAVVCSPAVAEAPEINYLAKDYGSFRRLMLDRMSAIAPAWRERSPADIGEVLVELLAYVGDSLSYYQDAVATEAYLGTARKRVSVRRHARMVDYLLHEGVNARAWVCFDAAADAPEPLPAGTRVLTRWSAAGAVVSPDELTRAVDAGAVVFETLDAVTFRKAHNEIAFYTWSDRECCLPAGATSATLLGPLPELRPKDPKERRDLLLFEEVMGPETGAEADADPRHRHVVRLTAAVDGTDPLTGLAIVEIAWDPADALPFPLCISAVTDAGTAIDGVSVVRGNLVLADHGFTVAAEDLGQVPPEAEGSFRPLLEQAPLTHAVPLPAGFSARPAVEVRTFRPQDATPAIGLDDGIEPWTPRRDLLSSGRFDRHFVAEVEEGGRARLRFGDEESGRRPPAGLAFTATYRVGNGTAGNLGAAALVQAVVDAQQLPLNPTLPAADQESDRHLRAADLGRRIKRLRNPLPAWGGVEAQSLEEVRQYAPQAFRVQLRAVTEADYAEVAERHPEVQRAVATFRWTGSWYTVFVTVDRLGGGAVDDAFKQRLRDHLEPFRMAAYDLEVNGPQLVALDLKLRVCVKPDYFRAHVLAALLARLGTRVLPDGQRGLFHPDDWTFGQPVYLSRIYAAATAVEGVDSVIVETFQRLGRPAATEIADGVLPIGRLEIARLDNDPNFAENGRLAIVLGGGK